MLQACFNYGKCKLPLRPGIAVQEDGKLVDLDQWRVANCKTRYWNRPRVRVRRRRRGKS